MRHSDTNSYCHVVPHPPCWTWATLHRKNMTDILCFQPASSNQRPSAQKNVLQFVSMPVFRLVQWERWMRCTKVRDQTLTATFDRCLHLCLLSFEGPTDQISQLWCCRHSCAAKLEIMRIPFPPGLTLIGYTARRWQNPCKILRKHPCLIIIWHCPLMFCLPALLSRFFYLQTCTLIEIWEAGMHMLCFHDNFVCPPQRPACLRLCCAENKRAMARHFCCHCWFSVPLCFACLSASC